MSSENMMRLQPMGQRAKGQSAKTELVPMAFGIGARPGPHHLGCVCELPAEAAVCSRAFRSTSLSHDSSSVKWGWRKEGTVRTVTHNVGKAL